MKILYRAAANHDVTRYSKSSTLLPSKIKLSVHEKIDEKSYKKKKKNIKELVSQIKARDVHKTQEFLVLTSCLLERFSRFFQSRKNLACGELSNTTKNTDIEEIYKDLDMLYKEYHERLPNLDIKCFTSIVTLFAHFESQNHHFFSCFDSYKSDKFLKLFDYVEKKKFKFEGKDVLYSGFVKNGTADDSLASPEGYGACFATKGNQIIFHGEFGPDFYLGLCYDNFGQSLGEGRTPSISPGFLLRNKIHNRIAFIPYMSLENNQEGLYCVFNNNNKSYVVYEEKNRGSKIKFKHNSFPKFPRHLQEHIDFFLSEHYDGASMAWPTPAQSIRNITEQLEDNFSLNNFHFTKVRDPLEQEEFFLNSRPSRSFSNQITTRQQSFSSSSSNQRSYSMSDIFEPEETLEIENTKQNQAEFVEEKSNVVQALPKAYKTPLNKDGTESVIRCYENEGIYLLPPIINKAKDCVFFHLDLGSSVRGNEALQLNVKAILRLKDPKIFETIEQELIASIFGAQNHLELKEYLKELYFEASDPNGIVYRISTEFDKQQNVLSYHGIQTQFPRELLPKSILRKIDKVAYPLDDDLSEAQNQYICDSVELDKNASSIEVFVEKRPVMNVIGDVLTLVMKTKDRYEKGNVLIANNLNLVKRFSSALSKYSYEINSKRLRICNECYENEKSKLPPA